MQNLEDDDQIIVIQDSSHGNPKDDQQEIVFEELDVSGHQFSPKHKNSLHHTPRQTYNDDLINRTPENRLNRSNLIDNRVSSQHYSKSLHKQNAKDLDLHNPHEKLIHQLRNEEFDQQQRLYIDKFITMFSNNQNTAIQYLIDNGIIADTEQQIAEVIRKTDGLNRDAINKFFGSTKERNQRIFEAYCQQLNLKGVPYLNALRVLLQRFRLSGEAQQVDRMVYIFAGVYHQQNPTVFDSDQTPYVLAYSFIMLSTDSASLKIQQKDKMTKEQFVKNNAPIFKSIPISYFEQVYDQINKEPFQTSVDYIEQMYNRMILCNEPLQGDSIRKALQLAFDLMKGSNVIKYGRMGKPSERKVFLSPDEKRICWKSIANNQEPARYINISDVHDLALGCNTTDIMKRNQIPIEFDMFCFSVITTQRTVDCQINDLEMKSKWINYLRAVIITRREHEAQRAQMNLKRHENDAKREEIWKNDILPYWQDHWDYKRNKPENFKKYHSVKKEEAIQRAQNQANSRSIITSICSCLKKTILLHPITSQQQMQPQSLVHQSSDIQNNDEPMIIGKKNKSLLLMILWKLGIPDFVRTTIWPIIIGNRLELTQNLYQILAGQVHRVQGSFKNDSMLLKYFQLIDEDMHSLKETFPFIEHEKEQQLLSILHASIIYRPDFGYIQGMGYLASVLVYQLSEYDSFQAFNNLLHQYPFLSIFIGDMRQIEWRISFFDSNFQRILPLVYAHLKAINVSSRIYLIKWFMTLFAQQFTISILCRLWDNFMLEGEIYLFKVAISYIKYFQVELKMSNLDEVSRILSTLQSGINEDYFFIQTDEIPVKEDEYTRFIEQQQAALLNTKIHQTLLV